MVTIYHVFFCFFSLSFFLSLFFSRRVVLCYAVLCRAKLEVMEVLEVLEVVGDGEV